MSRLHSWELYEQTKFFRAAMKDYEEETEKKHQGIAYNVELVDAQDPFEDLLLEVDLTEMEDRMEIEEEETPEELGKIRIPGPKPGVQMTLDEYRAMGSEEFEDRTDAQAKKWVLCLIEKNPALWCRRNIKTTNEQWQELAVEFYLRTGSTMSVNHIRSIWKKMKDSMLKILREPLGSARIEEELAKLEIYVQMKFFRKIMKEVEDAQQKDIVGKAYNVEILYDRAAFEDVFIKKVEDGTGMPPNDKRVEAEFQEHHQDEEMVESPRPQDADAELDPITAETASILGRLFDIGQDGNRIGQNLATTFIEVVDRPGLEDTSMVNHIRSIWKNSKDSMLEILKKPLDSARIEEELAKWEIYVQMKFFREIMKEVEDARQKDIVGKAYNVEILYDRAAFEDVFITKVEDGTGMPPNDKRDEAEFQEDEEMAESPRPQEAVQLDQITEEAASILGRLFDIGQDGNRLAQNLVTAFMEVVDRPGLEDTSMDEFWNSLDEVMANRQEAGEENRPALI
ncbi:hypothetical protein CAEBREN_22920 [Caenorhabditis brenneri]|uniref:Uncharacterized protein n=1 Tax=Caenorhabditis brenneri TaxID=135651 RepID=G0NDZ6_CAEBE|nr:hypothetical protein CAEBREN_22920 [Caenorhabditis brenneri]